MNLGITVLASLHPSKFANGCFAPVLIDDKGLSSKESEKKYENLLLLMRKSPFFEGGSA